MNTDYIEKEMVMIILENAINYIKNGANGDYGIFTENEISKVESCVKSIINQIEDLNYIGIRM